MKRVFLIFTAVLSLGFGTCVKAADASKAMPAIISYLLSGDTLPKVASITPANGAMNVPINTDIVITFSKPMDTSTFTTGTFNINDIWGGFVDFTIHVNSDTKVTLKPNKLYDNGKYLLTIRKFIKDKEGNQLEKETTSGFTATKYERVVISGKNGIVKDNKTNLWWQDEEYTDEEATAYDDDREHGKVLEWQSAINYCESLNYGSYSDWHLPSLDELRSIVDTKYSEPSINPVFKNTRSNDYWSSTTYTSNTPFAWVVYFDDGNDYWNDKYNSYYVRCVRGGE